MPCKNAVAQNRGIPIFRFNCVPSEFHFAGEIPKIKSDALATPRSVSFLFQYRTASLEMQSKKNRARRGSLSEIFLQLGAVPVRVVRRSLGAAGAAADCLFQ